jgi:lysozyme
MSTGTQPLKTTSSRFGALARSRVAVGTLALSAAAYVGIAVHEAYRGDAYLPTKDDVPTIGFGATRDVQMGDKITVERALVRLLEDASEYEQAVRRCAPVAMYQHEFDAWVSFTYNVGTNAFCKSTAAKYLNAGQYEKACDEMTKWVKQAGKTLPGLVKRREAERQKCLGN